MSKPTAKRSAHRRTIEEVAYELALSMRVGFDADRSKRIGASEIGQCSKKIVGVKLGQKPDEGVMITNGFAVRGNIMEDHWIAPLVRAWVADHGGELLYSGQADQISFQGKGVPLSSTPDGLAINVDRSIMKPYGVELPKGNNVFVPEFKSLDPRYGRHKLPKSAHVPQVLTQLGMIRKATKHKPEWGAVAYVDASDYFNIKWHPVQWNEKQFKGLVSRAAMMLNAKSWDQMQPEGKIAGGSECVECPFVKQCLGFVPWLAGDDPKALSKDKVAKVDKAAEAVELAKDAVEAAEQMKRDAEAVLVTTLASVKRNFVMGKFVASAKPTASQNRYDVKKLVAELQRLKGNPEKCRSQTKPGVSITVERR